jgi:transposase-like protein
VKDPVFIKDGVVVSPEWYEYAMKVLSGKGGCPFCGSTREPIVKPGDETFLPRKGCGDCDRWWGPPELR